MVQYINTCLTCSLCQGKDCRVAGFEALELRHGDGQHHPIHLPERPRLAKDFLIRSAKQAFGRLVPNDSKKPSYIFDIALILEELKNTEEDKFVAVRNKFMKTHFGVILAAGQRAYVVVPETVCASPRTRMEAVTGWKSSPGGVKARGRFSAG